MIRVTLHSVSEKIGGSIEVVSQQDIHWQGSVRSGNYQSSYACSRGDLIKEGFGESYGRRQGEHCLSSRENMNSRQCYGCFHQMEGFCRKLLLIN